MVQHPCDLIKGGIKNKNYLSKQQQIQCIINNESVSMNKISS